MCSYGLYVFHFLPFPFLLLLYMLNLFCRSLHKYNVYTLYERFGSYFTHVVKIDFLCSPTQLKCQNIKKNLC